MNKTTVALTRFIEDIAERANDCIWATGGERFAVFLDKKFKRNKKLQVLIFHMSPWGVPTSALEFVLGHTNKLLFAELQRKAKEKFG